MHTVGFADPSDFIEHTVSPWALQLRNRGCWRRNSPLQSALLQLPSRESSTHTQQWQGHSLVSRVELINGKQFSVLQNMGYGYCSELPGNLEKCPDRIISQYNLEEYTSAPEC